MMFFETESDLLQLLPERLRETAELSAICAVVGAEIDRINAQITVAVSDSFISTADEAGLLRWEKILGVSTSLDSSVKSRRDALIAKLMTKPPINLFVLKGIIEAYMGVEAEIAVSGYVVYVKYRGEVKTKDLTPLFVTVYEAMPANMLMEISYKYLTWDELDGLDMTFDELDAEGVAWEDFEKGVWING